MIIKIYYIIFLFLIGCASTPREIAREFNLKFDCRTFGVMTNIPNDAIFEEETSGRKIVTLSGEDYRYEFAANAKKIKTKEDYDKFMRLYENNNCAGESYRKDYSPYPSFHDEIEYIMVLQSKQEILKNIQSEQIEFVEVRVDSPYEKEKSEWAGMHDFLMAHFNRKEFPNIDNFLNYDEDEFSFNKDKEKYKKIRAKKYIFIKTGQGELSEYNFKDKNFLYKFAILGLSLGGPFSSLADPEAFQLHIPKGISIPMNEVEAKNFKKCQKDIQFISTYKVVTTSSGKNKYKQLQLEPIKWRIRCNDSSAWFKNY